MVVVDIRAHSQRAGRSLVARHPPAPHEGESMFEGTDKGLPIQQLSSLWGVPFRPPRPTELHPEGTSALLYPGEMHLVYAKGGSGKTTLGHVTCLQSVRRGGHALYIDYEGTREWMLHKLMLLGCTEQDASRIWYVKAREPLAPPAVRWLSQVMSDLGVRVLVVDSLARALAASNLEEQSNGDLNRFFDAMEPLRLSGAAVVFIDHVGHQKDALAMPSPRGASAKVDQVSAAYWVRVREGWSEDRPGSAELVVRKDRFGTRAEGDVAAVMRVIPDGARLKITLTAPTPPKYPGVQDQEVAEVVDRLLDDEEASRSKSALIKATVCGVECSPNAAEDAIDQMVARGFITALPGGKGLATRYSRGARSK